MELTKIQFEDGQKVSDAYVEINGVKHPVVKAQYQGKTPLSARNLNKLQENVGNAISDLDERVVSYRNVLVDEQALIKECGGLKLKKLNKLVGKTEQETREGYNLLNIQDKEQTLNGVTVKCKNGVITLNGTSNASEKFNIDFPLVSNVPIGTYSFIPLGRDLSKYDYWLFNTNYKYSYYATSGGSNVINQEQTSELTHFYLAIKPGVTFSNHIIKPLLVTNTYTTEEQFPPFEAYGASPTPNFPSEVKTVTGEVEVSIDNGNLFNFQKWVDSGFSINTGTKEIIDNGIKITATSGDTFTMTYGMDTTGGSNTNAINKYGFKVRPNTKYILTYEPIYKIARSVYVFYYDKDKKYIKFNMSPGSSLKFTTPENAEYVCFRFGISVNGGTEIFSNIRLNRGETDLGYVEHKSQVLPLTLGDIELCKIGDYADYIYRNGSKLFKKDNVGKYIVTGDEDWVLAAEGFWIAFSQAKSMYKAYCNYYENYTSYSGLVGQEKGFAFMYGNLYIRNKDYANATDFKAHLKELYNNGTPVVIYYPLATPTDTEITDTTLIAQLNALENAQLYEGITNISITGDNLTPIADIDYWTWFKGEDAETEVTDYEISNLPEHSGGANSYMLKKTGNIVVLAVDNIWVNSITANTWIDIGTVPEELRPEKTIQGMVIGSRGDSGNVGAYGKIGITADGVVRCKMNSDINLLSAFSFNLMWII